MAINALEAIHKISSSELISCYDMRFIKPLDEKLLHTIFKKYEVIITIEDGVIAGGFGSAITEFSARHHYTNKIEILGILNLFPEQGSVEELKDIAGISSEGITRVIEKYL